MEDRLSIKINIADRYYPLKIDRKDEEKIRLAAKQINEKVIQYKQRYADKDTQDFVTMAALQFVIKSMDTETKNDLSPFLDEIREIENELDIIIKS